MHLEDNAFRWHERTMLAETPTVEHLMAENKFVEAGVARILGSCSGRDLREQLVKFIKEIAS